MYQKNCEKFSVRRLRKWAVKHNYVIGSGLSKKSKICASLYTSTHPSTLRHHRTTKRQPVGGARSHRGFNPTAFSSTSPMWVSLDGARLKRPGAFRRRCNDLGKSSVLLYAKTSKLPHRRRSSKRMICRGLSKAHKRTKSKKPKSKKPKSKK